MILPHPFDYAQDRPVLLLARRRDYAPNEQKEEGLITLKNI